MIRRFLQDTFDLLLDALAAVGLLRGGSGWYKQRLRRRIERARGDAANISRSVGATHRMCRECGALVPNKMRECSECGATMAGVPRGGAGRALQALAPAFGSVSTSLLGVICAIYLATAVASPSASSPLGPSGEILGRLGAMNLYFIVYEVQWWRLVNPIFLHGGLMHVGFNAYVLAAIGPLIENELGGRRLFVLFIGSGIGSFVLSAVWSLFSPHWSVGASGALFGLMGFGIVAGYRRRGGVLQQAAPRLLMWAAINVLLGFSLGFVDNAAHLGGLLVGALWGLLGSNTRPLSRGSARLWNLLCAVAGLLPLVGFTLALLSGS